MGIIRMARVQLHSIRGTILSLSNIKQTARLDPLCCQYFECLCLSVRLVEIEMCTRFRALHFTKNKLLSGVRPPLLAANLGCKK